ncbi:MAG: hypothetical protein KY455_08870 [Euryarchaeota archaeon]|nr:hypothetical protein [Euryarchaeota archaeon]
MAARPVALLAMAIFITLAFSGCASDATSDIATGRAEGCLEEQEIPEGEGWVTILVKRPHQTREHGFFALQAKPALVAWRAAENDTTDYVTGTEFRTMDWMKEQEVWVDSAMPVGEYQWFRISVVPDSVRGTRIDGYTAPVRVQGDRLSIEPGTEDGLFHVEEGRCTVIQAASLMTLENGQYVIR